MKRKKKTLFSLDSFLKCFHSSFKLLCLSICVCLFLNMSLWLFLSPSALLINTLSPNLTSPTSPFLSILLSSLCLFFLPPSPLWLFKVSLSLGASPCHYSSPGFKMSLKSLLQSEFISIRPSHPGTPNPRFFSSSSFFFVLFSSSLYLQPEQQEEGDIDDVRLTLHSNTLQFIHHCASLASPDRFANACQSGFSFRFPNGIINGQPECFLMQLDRRTTNQSNEICDV